MTDRHHTLVYLHIPRTAGSAVREVMTGAYKADEVALVYDPAVVPGAIAPSDVAAVDEAVRARWHLVFGTFAFGIHEHLPRPSRYITMIRDPLDRVASLYRVVSAGGDAAGGTPSLEEWLDASAPQDADNGMVRLISGHDWVPFGHCTDDMLVLALEHIDAAFEAVLIRGRMPQARQTLERLTGRALPPMRRVAATNSPGHEARLDSAARARLLALNELDAKLFAAVVGGPSTKPVAPVVRGPDEAGIAGAGLSLAADRPGRLSIGDRTLLFMHIAKTGGTSVREAVIDAYASDERVMVYDPADLGGAVRQEQFAELPAEQRLQLRLVMGHFQYGLHQSLGRPFRYLAILRDPVERVVSLYYHYLHLRGAWLRRLRLPGVRREGKAQQEQTAMRRQRLSLEEWVFEQQRLAVDNGMTRNIAARSGVGFGKCPDDLLDEALGHVDEHFAALLVTDELDRSLPLLESIIGRTLRQMPHDNVNRRRPPLDDLDPRALDRIRRLNRLDVRLYDIARKRLGTLL